MNRVRPEMLNCLNIPGNVSGNCTDMTVLERQRARMKWQEEEEQLQIHEQQEHDQNYYCGSEFGVFSGSQVQTFQSLIAGGAAMGEEVVTPSMKPDPGLENGWPDLGRIEIPGSGFGTSGYGNGSGYELNYAILRTTSCPPAVAAAAIKRQELVLSEKMSSGVGRESFKKRKTEKINTKVVVEDDTKSKKLKGCAEEGDSKITEQNSYQNNTNNREKSADDTSKENSKVSEAQKPDYIHVRARRGQATDSHSLAERVRREKISERMKYLQDLVPGCNKITGKAGMLDEIINYVQSLQRQVEFLSMKLAAVHPTIDFNIDNLFPKEVFPACTTNFPTTGMSTEMSNPGYLQFNPVSCCGLEIGINPPDMAALRRTISAPLSILEPFVDSSSFNQIQPSSAWDADLQNFCNIEFHPERSSAFPSQHFTGSIETSNIKMEM